MPAEFDDATLKLGTPAGADTLPSAGVVLTVVSGPDAGKTIRLEDLAHRRALIGQSAACDIQLADRAVSRRHAAIEIEQGRLRVLDIGSRNGTFCGRVRIHEASIEPGTEIVVGQTTLRIDLDGQVHRVPLSPEPQFGRVLGASPQMRRLFPLFARLVGRSTHVLLEGEAGTGKALVAEAIHEAEGRPDAPFVVFDPASFRPEQLEDALFGEGGGTCHLQQATGGSLFVDEIGDLPANLQAKLLRVLERRELRLSGCTSVPIAVRVFAATRRNLDADIQNRLFREDLFFALANPRIELPPLRKRAGDVAYLTQRFWRTLGGAPHELSPAALAKFSEHPWPGNVRELYYAVARSLASGEEAPASSALASHRNDDFIDQLLGSDLPLPVAREKLVAEFEQRYMQQMLKQHGGHIGKAAAASGISRRYFQKLRAKT
jgi:DNA-binding NtrC family response regulator